MLDIVRAYLNKLESSSFGKLLEASVICQAQQITITHAEWKDNSQLQDGLISYNYPKLVDD